MDNEMRRMVGATTLDVKMEYLGELLKPLIFQILDEYKKAEIGDKPLLTIEDIAKKFKVTKATVHNWMKRGSIEGKKFGKNRYFTEDEVKKSMVKYGFSKHWESN